MRARLVKLTVKTSEPQSSVNVTCTTSLHGPCSGWMTWLRAGGEGYRQG